MTLAGTPEPPQGMFFRVKPSNSNTFPLSVQLRKKLWIGSYTIASRIAINDPKVVRDAMSLLAAKHSEHQAETTARNNLLGDYPPKTLEHQ